MNANSAIVKAFVPKNYHNNLPILTVTNLGDQDETPSADLFINGYFRDVNITDNRTITIPPAIDFINLIENPVVGQSFNVNFFFYKEGENCTRLFITEPDSGITYDNPAVNGYIITNVPLAIGFIGRIENITPGSEEIRFYSLFANTIIAGFALG
jgi:hypothetical protein